MPAELDLIDHGRRLQFLTAQTRMRLMESELSLGLTFCMVLETELRLGEIDAARKFLAKAAQTIDHVGRSIRAAAEMGPREKQALRRRLARVEGRLREVRSKLTRGKVSKQLRIVPWPLPQQYRPEL